MNSSASRNWAVAASTSTSSRSSSAAMRRNAGDEVVHVVGADDAAAGRERQRLEHAGELHTAGGQEGIVLERDATEARNRHAGCGQTLAHLELVARGRHRRHRVGAQAQPLGDGRRGHGGEIVHADHGAQRAARAQLGHLGGRAVGIGEVQREEVIGRVRLEGARLFGGTDEIDAERARGVDEILGAVRRRRQEQEQPVHDARPDDGRARPCPPGSRGCYRRRDRSCRGPRPPRGALP